MPDIVPKGLFARNIKEFTNLAALLPELYQEFGAQPLVLFQDRISTVSATTW